MQPVFIYNASDGEVGTRIPFYWILGDFPLVEVEGWWKAIRCIGEEDRLCDNEDVEQNEAQYPAPRHFGRAVSGRGV